MKKESLNTHQKGHLLPVWEHKRRRQELFCSPLSWKHTIWATQSLAICTCLDMAVEGPHILTSVNINLSKLCKYGRRTQWRSTFVDSWWKGLVSGAKSFTASVAWEWILHKSTGRARWKVEDRRKLQEDVWAPELDIMGSMPISLFTSQTQTDNSRPLNLCETHGLHLQNEIVVNVITVIGLSHLDCFVDYT